MQNPGAMMAVLTSLAALLSGGCYRPDLTGPGGFLCARSPECPSGFVCQDRVCVRSGQPRADLRVERGLDGIDGGLSDRRPSEQQLPRGLVCQTPTTVNTIESGQVGDGFDFERSAAGVLVVSYTTAALIRELRLARKPGPEVSWSVPKTLASGVGEATAVAIDDFGCVNNAVLVAYRTGPMGSLRVQCDGCPGSPPPHDLDPGTNVGAYVDIVLRDPNGCGFWVAYQGPGTGGYLRRASLSLPSFQYWSEPVEVPGGAVATHLAQDWDTTTHAITYISGTRIFQGLAAGTQGASWTTTTFAADAATRPEDRGIAQVGSSVVYATGPASSPTVHHVNSGVVGEVALGSRPSLASNGTDEAVAFLSSGNGWVVARTGTASWGTPVARIEGAERILIRAGETPDAWEVVYRRASGLFHSTVTCR